MCAIKADKAFYCVSSDKIPNTSVNVFSSRSLTHTHTLTHTSLTNEQIELSITVALPTTPLPEERPTLENNTVLSRSLKSEQPPPSLCSPPPSALSPPAA